MKKTANTKKLVLDRQKIRELVGAELNAAGGLMVETHYCGGPPPTYSCHNCDLSQLCG